MGVAALVAAIFALAACGGEDEPIRIGWVGPLSAGATSEGEEMLAASRIAVEEINAEGGVLGRNVELVVRDTMADPDVGAAAMEDLIDEEGVVAVVGEVHSSAALTEIEVAHDRGVPFVVADAWTDEITAAGFDEVFRIAPANSLIYEQVSDWLVDVGFQQVAAVVEDTAYGTNATSLIEAELDAAGVGSTFISVDPASLDSDAVVDALASEPADLVMVLIASDTAFTLVNEICEAGIAPSADAALYVGAGLGVASGLWDEVGDCGRYVIAENLVLPEAQWNSLAVGLNEALEDEGLSAAIGGFAGYDGVRVVADAIEQAGSTESADVIAALGSTDFTGSRGAYSFSTETEPAWRFQQFLEAPVSIVQYDEVGQAPADAVVLAPSDWATADTLAKPR